MKTVLSIQDLSCVGRCSLTVTLPTLSAMGCRCSVLPTAVLSTHTGFPAPTVIPLTEHIAAIGTHWEQVGVTFDAVLTGYLSDPAQAEAVCALVLQHRSRGSLVITDPAMGDHGKLYSGIGPAHVQAMMQLCAAADILLPNLTEAALLTGLPYREEPDECYWKKLTDALLERFPVSAVVITGICTYPDSIGFYGSHRQTGNFSYQTPIVPKQFHGTGDLFSAVFAGALLQGETLRDAGIRAADFVRLCVAQTACVTPHGVEFEPLLPQLYQTERRESMS